MLYLDTSLLVAVLTNGAETERMQHWLGQQPVDDLALSDWVATEFSSALSIKLRTGQIGAAHRADCSGDICTAGRGQLYPRSGLAVAVSDGCAIRGPTYAGLARWRCLASRRLRRPGRDALHVRATAEPCRFGARRKDDPTSHSLPFRRHGPPRMQLTSL